MSKDKPRNVIFILLIVLFAAAAGYFCWATESESTSYEPIIASHAKWNDEELTLQLDCTDSGHFFHGYDYSIENHTLYLTVRHGPARFHAKRWPVQIDIQDSALSNVHSVYLRDGKSARLVHIGLPFEKGKYISYGLD